MRKILTLMFAVAAFIIAASCSGPSVDDPDPRNVVVKFFRAMEDSDRTIVGKILDFPSLLGPRDTDYALKSDTARVFFKPEEMIDDLMPGGLTYSRWQPLQKVVGSAEVEGDTAYVEISFINKQTSTQYYNKAGLRRVNDRWKIFTFSAGE
jgi:hypothetical protein